MTYQEALDQINLWIVTNGNNEITAAVLNPVLQALLEACQDTTGELGDLATTDKSNLVAAINEVLSLVENVGGNYVSRFIGQPNPNTTPPSGAQAGDVYVQVNNVGLPMSVWQFTGLVWTTIGGGSSQTNLSYNPATGEVSNDNGNGFTIPPVSNENPGLATPDMLEAANAVKGRIVQYGSWSTLVFMSAWENYKVLFGDTVVDVVFDYVGYSPCDGGYTRYDRVEVDSDGVVSLVTGVESTGFPDKPAATAGKVTIGFLQITDSEEFWIPVSEGFITKESQNFQAVFGTGAVTLPVTENFNYLLQPGITQVDGIESLLVSSPELNRFGQEMKIFNATGGDVVLEHSGTGLYFPNIADFTLPNLHVASFFYDLNGFWIFSGSSVQGGGGLDEAGVRDTPLTGLSTSTGGAITATDKVIEAFGKIQNTLTNIFSASVFGAAINALTGKTTPVDADGFAIFDSAASNAAKKLTWANLKATLKAYFDPIYIKGNVRVQAAAIATMSSPTYYIGGSNNIVPTTSSRYKMLFPVNATSFRANIFMYTNGTNYGSGENIQVVLHDVTTNTSHTIGNISITGYSQGLLATVNATMTADNEFEIRLITPSFSTPPQQVVFGGDIDFF